MFGSFLPAADNEKLAAGIQKQAGTLVLLSVSFLLLTSVLTLGSEHNLLMLSALAFWASC